MADYTNWTMKQLDDEIKATRQRMIDTNGHHSLEDTNKLKQLRDAKRALNKKIADNKQRFSNSNRNNSNNNSNNTSNNNNNNRVNNTNNTNRVTNTNRGNGGNGGNNQPPRQTISNRGNGNTMPVERRSMPVPRGNNMQGVYMPEAIRNLPYKEAAKTGLFNRLARAKGGNPLITAGLMFAPEIADGISRAWDALTRSDDVADPEFTPDAVIRPNGTITRNTDPTPEPVPTNDGGGLPPVPPVNPEPVAEPEPIPLSTPLGGQELAKAPALIANDDERRKKLQEDILSGKYGNGRDARLQAALADGYSEDDYNAAQKAINSSFIKQSLGANAPARPRVAPVQQAAVSAPQPQPQPQQGYRPRPITAADLYWYGDYVNRVNNGPSYQDIDLTDGSPYYGNPLSPNRR